MPSILIVDDSALQRSIIRRLLAPLGASITEAGNGKEALEALENQKFNAMVTDLLMPVMDGNELISQASARYPGLPIVVFTADIQETTRTKALELGAAAFVNKPSTGSELADAVARAIKA